MTTVAKKHRQKRFSSSSLYQKQEPHPFHYLSERATFWVAVVTIFSFVTGNMLGQHGWHVFWKSVMGGFDEKLVTYTGFVAPIQLVPDYQKWAKYGGDVRSHTYREVPQDVLMRLPAYTPNNTAPTYTTKWMGNYEGDGDGSHPGLDIIVPKETPINAIGNGIVTRVDYDAGGYGNFIVIKHPHVPDPMDSSKLTDLYSVYGHLTSTLVTEGEVVQKGEVIAASGQTGFATAPHLHFQIDMASAPWHPYWPFTGAESRQAGLSMAGAVDAGLHRERGLEYTVDPMLYVQTHLSASANAVAYANTGAAAATSQAVKASTPKLTSAQMIEQRKQQRMAQLQAAPTPSAPVVVRTETLVMNTDAPVPAPAPAPAPVPAPVAKTPVADVRIDSDGIFTPDHSVRALYLTLLDDQGNIITNPDLAHSIAVRTTYGKATFTPASLSAKDFKNGKATVQMKPEGIQTIVPIVYPYNTVQQPIRYKP
jgi:murein DD-endopeptidase MepM/ murein hydrolase activator NlpD